MKNDHPDKQENPQSIFRKPSDSDINLEFPNSQFQLDFKLNELGDFEDIIQNKSVKGNFFFISNLMIKINLKIVIMVAYSTLIFI